MRSLRQANSNLISRYFHDSSIERNVTRRVVFRHLLHFFLEVFEEIFRDAPILAFFVKLFDKFLNLLE